MTLTMTYINVHLLKTVGYKSLETFCECNLSHLDDLPTDGFQFFIMESLRRAFTIFMAIFCVFASMIAAEAATSAVPSGAITVNPIPQRPPYAPHPWVYPKPTTQSNPQ